MASPQSAAGGDDVSYSHTLKKLFRVNVDKGPGSGDATRPQLGRAFGQTGLSRRSFRSGQDQLAGPTTPEPAAGLQQSRGLVSAPAGPAFHRDRTLHQPLTPAASAPSGPTRRSNPFPPPDMPASFMRAPHSIGITPRRRQRRSYTAETPPSGLGPGRGAQGGASPSGGPPVRRVASLSGSSLMTAAADAAAAAAAAAGQMISPRGRGSSCYSNLSYKPAGNVTAEPAAAVLQRRRVAFAFATRNGAGTPAAGSVLRSSWGAPGSSPPGGLLSSRHSAGALGFFPMGLGSPETDGRGGGVKAGDGGGGGDSGLGALSSEDAMADAYESGWPLSAWRGVSTTADGAGGEPAGRLGTSGGAQSEPGGPVLAASNLHPMTSPHLGPILRRSPVPGEMGAAGKPSPFAPPQQLYMKTHEEAAGGGPVATVGSSAAKALVAGGSLAQPARFVPSLDLALLRPTSSGPPAMGGGEGEGGPTAAEAQDSDAEVNLDADGGGDASGVVDVMYDIDGDDDGDVVRPMAFAGGSLKTMTGLPPSPKLRAGSLVSKVLYDKSVPGAAGAAVAGAAAADGGAGGDAAAGDAQQRAKGRSAGASMDGEAATTATGPSVLGDTSKILQVGISVAALMEFVRALGPSQKFATTAEVVARWLLPPTKNSSCRFLDMIMARVKIPLGEPPDGGGGGGGGGGGPARIYPGQPVLHPDRTWFGPPDYYVIHAWSGNFSALVAALREFCVAINKTPSSTYVWLDVVAVNHHPGRKDKQELAHCRQVMAVSRRALLVLDAMATSMTRLWCLYEIWLATCSIPGASPSRLALLNGGADWDAVADSFFRIDMSRCATSSPDDRARLLEDMIRVSRDTGSGGAPSSSPASGTTISPYGVVAALPQLSAAVRSAVFQAAAQDLAEARKVSRSANGMLALLDAVERYAMIRRISGGHVEAEEQLEAVVAAAMGMSGGKHLASGAAAAAASSAPPTPQNARPIGGAAAAASGEKFDVTSAAPSAAAAGADGAVPHLPRIVSPNSKGGAAAGASAPVDDDSITTAAIVAAAVASSSTSTNALWRKKPATLAALALLQSEHGRLLQAMTHVSMALSCVPGLALMRPATPPDDGDGDDRHNHHNHHYNHHNHHSVGHSRSSRSLSTNLMSSRTRYLAHGDNGDNGMTAAQRAAAAPAPAPAVPGAVVWKGPYWELSNPQNTTADAARAIFMTSMVEAACGRHEVAAQLALQAGLARAALLGPAHPATLTARRAAVSYLLSVQRLPEAHLLARSILREAVAEHGESHPSVGICHGAVAQVLAAQNKAEQAYTSAQRGAEVLASSLGRAHPATLDALQLCADMLETAREFGKAVALMRMVVQGRSAPGAIRSSPASPAFLAPNNRLLHLRTIAALEEKAMAEEHSRRTMIGVMRGLARLEAELRAALMAMSGTAPQIQHDLELVLMAQNKRYEAAMLRKGELR